MGKNKKNFLIALLVLITLSVAFTNIKSVAAVTTEGGGNGDGGEATPLPGSGTGFQGRLGCTEKSVHDRPNDSIKKNSTFANDNTAPHKANQYFDIRGCPTIKIKLVYIYKDKKTREWKEKQIGNSIWYHKAVEKKLITDDWLTLTNNKKSIKGDSNKFIADVVGSNNNPDAEKFAEWKRELKIKDSQIKKDEKFCTFNAKKPTNCYGKKGYRLKAELWLYRSYQGRNDKYKYEYVKDYLNSADLKGMKNCKSSKIAINFSTIMRLKSKDTKYKCDINNNDICSPPTFDIKKRYNDGSNNDVYRCAKGKNCGYGFWLADVTKVLTNDPELNCNYVRYDEPNKKAICQITGTVDGKEILKQVNCTKYDEEGAQYKINGKKYNLNQICPTTHTRKSTSCQEVPGKYGKCKLTETSEVTVPGPGKTVYDSTLVSEEVNCNDFYKSGSKFNNIILNPLCPYRPKYRYPIDTACIGCDSDNSNGNAYQIEDTEDWTAIAHSTIRTDNEQLKNNYKENDGKFLCRNEYSIKYPNKSTTQNIKIKSGGFITINLEQANIINNLHDIKVIHKKECIDQKDEYNNIINYYNKNPIDTGDITIIYKSNDNYAGTYDLKKDTTQTISNETSSIRISGNNGLSNTTDWKPGYYKKVTITSTSTYKLKDYIYKCTNPTTGHSKNSSASDTCDEGYHKNSNPILPIGFSNQSSITITFKYIPTDEGTLAKINNIGLDKWNSFSDGATEKAPATDSNAKNKVNSSAANTDTSQCLSNLTNETSYSCEFKNNENPPGGDDNKNCCDIIKSGTKTTYYGSTCQQTTPEEYNKQCCSKTCEGGFCCPGSTVNNPICPEKDEETNKYYCPTTKCKLSTDNSCKTSKGKAIYRTIDLNDPFPGQNGLGRLTGTNWCSKYIGTGEITCVNNENNYFVKKYILNNRKVNGKQVYNKTPLYTFRLDSNTIQKIREYNNNHKYSDFTLTKNNDEHYYRSAFARNTDYGYIKDVNYSQCDTNINTCANN